MCSDVVRSARVSGVGPGSEHDRRWWAVIFFLPVRCEGLGGTLAQAKVAVRQDRHPYLAYGEGASYVCSMTHLSPLMLLLRKATSLGSRVRQSSAQHCRSCQNSHDCTCTVRVEMCCGRVRSVGSVAGVGEGLGRRWCIVMVCSPVRCEGSGQYASTGKSSGQARSAFVSGVACWVIWVVHAQWGVCAFLCACVCMDREMSG